MSTIVAIATSLGAGGIGIVRISGEDALQIAKNIFAVAHSNKKETNEPNSAYPSQNETTETNATHSNKNETTEPNVAYPNQNEKSETNFIKCGYEQNSIQGDIQTKVKEFGSEPAKLVFGQVNCSEFSDKGYAVYFKAPNSFTGEDVVEFQLHGGVRILDGVVLECVKQGAVVAQRGEFTKRAFLNGKMTLANAEGVVDMINAESASAVRAAYKLMDGEFGKKMVEIENKLIGLISGLEASLDYPDEMEDEILPQTPIVIDETVCEIDKLLETVSEGRIAKHGIKIVLVGQTNVGKSSLMNAILKRERAIVTATAGTTRDVVSESIEYKGLKFNIVDTAGIRDTLDEIEQIGVARAKDEILSADVVFYVKETNQNCEQAIEKQNFETTADTQKSATTEIQKLDKYIKELLQDKTVFVVENKSDKYGHEYGRFGDTFKISAKFNRGVNELLDSVYELFKSGGVESGEVLTSQRHISALNKAREALVSAKAGNANNSTDCTLIDLKVASDAIGEITGTSASEEIIEQIFSRFCVGK